MNKKASRTPYPLRDGKPEMRASVVTFLDILGYGEMSQTSNEVLHGLRDALEEAGEILSGEGIYDERFVRPYSIKVFTDNIVIGWPIPVDHPLYADGERELGYTLLNVASYQLMMATRGYFVRGGLSVGPHYMDESVVFGPALMESYGLESKTAVYPRVVLSKSAHEMALEHCTYYHPHDSAPQNTELLIDSDGLCFVNYLRGSIGHFDDERVGIEWLKSQLGKHKYQVEKNLEEHRNNRRIWDKYAWVGRYHNHTVEALALGKSLMVNPKLLELGFSPLLPPRGRPKRAKK
ncbi:hypothetical protein [Polyangium sp. 15x6]|uniref:hypothetical protein n=1 Tax=Polyangium sp. 15x6 TaxID=3042687 RepID=UPI00249A1582|nr:hypothetical protein [Polyangium sp. 15x6]MDI3292141.1 hypothetical protein [Polyangium sp. 15x6]